MRARYGWALLLGLLLVAGAQGDPRKELAKLEGLWFAASATQDGKELPKEEVKKIALVVKGGSYTFTSGASIVKGKYKLDPSTRPKSIDAIRTSGDKKGMTLKGIYELEGDTFKVCLADPDKDRPKEFKAPEGSGCRLFVFKKATKKRDK
jgi:uncharacterized protein (TIGR03067 family)